MGDSNTVQGMSEQSDDEIASDARRTGEMQSIPYQQLMNAERALSFAVAHHGHQGTEPRIVVASAKAFYAFLKDPEGATTPAP